MPSATSTLSTLATVVVNTGVDLATVIFQTYWPYVLVFGVLISIAVWIKRAVHMGHK